MSDSAYSKMPKSKPLFSSNLRKYFNEFGADICNTDGKILYFKICVIRKLRKINVRYNSTYCKRQAYGRCQQKREKN